MCNATVPSVTLQTAVLMQVQEFAKNGQTFSVHDITRVVRNKTYKGDMEIPEVEVQGASFRFDIPHTKVKSIFDDLWRSGVFDPDFTLTRNFNGTYFEYTPSTWNNPPASVTPVAPVSNTYNPLVTTTPVISPVITAPSVPVAKLDKNVVFSRVNFYLNTCKNKGYRPTLKQVQSAIKRDQSTGWTCEQLRDLIETDLGYNVVDNPDKESSAQVAVV